MILIESRPFTRRLYQLGDAADELLRAIQGELMKKPDQGEMVPGLGGVRKARIPAVAKENVAATAICTCTWRRGSIPLADFAR